jgi:pilus assembly protein Flp/PilA
MDEAGLTAAPHQLLTRCELHAIRGRGPEEGGVIAIRRTLRRLLADQTGATAIEYGLIAALIIIAMMGGLATLGGGAGGMWTRLKDNVETHM